MTTTYEQAPPLQTPRAAATDSVIRCNGLNRYFGVKCAVDSVSFTVPRGSVFALLGRNGSGKSTLVRMLMGMLAPTRGSASILGDDCQHIRPITRGRIGYIAEGHPSISGMRVRDVVGFHRSFYPSWDERTFDAVIAQFSIGMKARSGSLSRGQQAGVSLGMVLATHPELLVMDDPAMGLDPVARRTLLEAMILVTRKEGHTIFFTSHEIADVERVADHIAILDQSILRVSAPIDVFRSRVRRLGLSFSHGIPRKLPPIRGLLQTRRDGNDLSLILVDSDDSAEHDATETTIAQLGATSTRDLPLSLEDAVIAYLGQREERLSLLQQEARP